MLEESSISPFLARDPSEGVVVRAVSDRSLQVAASTISLLKADDLEATNTYQRVMSQPRSDIPTSLYNELENIHLGYLNSQKKVLPGLLADPTIPFAAKEGAIKAVQNGEVGDTNHITELTSQSLIKDSPSSGNTAESIRDLWASRIDDVNNKTVERQKIVDAAKGAKNNNFEQLVDIVEQMAIPMMDGITGAKIASRMKEGGVAGAAALPGSYRKQLSDGIRNMDADQRIEFAKRLAPIAVQSSGVITNKNQMNIEAWLQEVVDGKVTTTDEWVENVFNVLDLVGVGMFLRSIPTGVRRANSAFKSSVDAKRAQESAFLFRDAPPLETPTPQGPAPAIPGVNGEAVAPTPQTRTNAATLQTLENEYASLLEATSGKLDKGQVASLLAEKKQLQESLAKGKLTTKQLAQKGVAQSALERRQNIEAQIQNIDSQIQRNAEAQKAEGRLAEIEKERVQLEKQLDEEPAALNPIVEGIRRASLNSVTGFHNPASPAGIFEVTNPTSAKNLHAQIYFQSDDLAEPLTGMTKNDTLVKSVTPQIDDGTGKVSKVVDNKEEMIKRVLATQAGLEIKNTYGGLGFTEKELASAVNAKRTDVYENVSGLQINDGMSSFRVSDDGMEYEFSGVYTTGDGGWLRAEQAVEQAAVALRKQGITNKDVEVLSFDGQEYVPVKLSDVVGKDGDYAVRIRLKERISPEDVTNWDSLDVKRNLLDFVETTGENTWGSVQRHILDAASMLHKQITGATSIADDKAARLAQHFIEVFSDQFSTPFMKLPKDRRVAVEQYIKEANIKEIAFDRNALATRFSKEELDVLEGWRDAWDVMWVFENYDLAKSLNRDGFLLFEHPNLRMVVKERAKRYDNRLAYDPATDTVRKLTDAEIDNIYNRGGNIAEARNTVTINGVDTKHIIVRNSGNEVARKVLPTDKLLEYRDGYYQVSYKHPQFIEKIDTKGERTIVGVVGSKAEAERVKARLQQSDPANNYATRGDDRKINRDANSNYWDLQHSRGRIAQRHRGQLLQNSVGTKNLGDIDFIESPADSAVRAAHSLGGRLAMRDTMDAMKMRFLEQFKDVVGRNEFGQPIFPANRGEIFKKGVATDKQLADARTTWEYIRSIENGYINAMDNALKNAMNGIADIAGLKGYDTIEKMARAGSDLHITGAIKGTVFASFLATNPLRMWLIQPVAALRMFGYNPQGILSGRVPRLVMEVVEGRLANQLPKSKDAQDFNHWFHRTGVTQAITRGNLVRGTLLDAAGRSTTAGQVKDATIGNLRKYGYDSAETFNLMIHGAAIYDRYKARGLDVNNTRVMDEMHMELRSVTRNMNLAGDMPYNQNALALLFTYMQVPHKFILQPFDRQLSRADRARLIAADLTWFGLPMTLLSQVVDENLIPENEHLRSFLEDGLTNIMINGIASYITGERQGVDTSTFNPYGLEAFGKLAEQALFDGGIKGMIDNTPAGRVFGLNSDSRIGLAMKMATMYFTSPYTNDSLADAVQLKDVARAFAKISSGWTNFEKARAAWVLGQVRDKQGRLTDDQVTAFESVMIALGMNTKDSATFNDVARAGGASFKGAEDAARSDAKRIASLINHVALDGREREMVTRLYTQIIMDKSWAPKNIDFNKYLMKLQESTEVSARQKIIENIFEVTKLTDPTSTNGAFITNIDTSILTANEKEYLQKTFQDTIKNLEQWNKLADEESKQRNK